VPGAPGVLGEALDELPGEVLGELPGAPIVATVPGEVSGEAA